MEREQRGWTYETTARELTAVGCPMQASAVHKIEKSTGRRRIQVDELVAFARVFRCQPADLLRPIDEARDAQLKALLGWYQDAVARYVNAADEVASWAEALRDHVGGDLAETRRVIDAAGLDYPTGLDADRYVGTAAAQLRRRGEEDS